MTRSTESHWVPTSERKRQECVRVFLLRQEGFTVEDVILLTKLSESTVRRYQQAGKLLVAARMIDPDLVNLYEF